MIKEMIIKSRSFRRFYESHKIKEKTLKGLIDLARLSPSAANLQPLKYILSCKAQKNGLIFPCLKWAGYLKDWPGPRRGERPSAYITVLGDTRISRSFGCDLGIAAHSILLGASELGLGGCMIGSIDRKTLRKNLKIPLRYKILLVVALGKPKEEIMLEEARGGEGIKYWRDDEGKHHVPKRKLNDIILR